MVKPTKEEIRASLKQSRRITGFRNLLSRHGLNKKELYYVEEGYGHSMVRSHIHKPVNYNMELIDEFYKINDLIHSVESLDDIKLYSLTDFDKMLCMQYSGKANSRDFYDELPYSLPDDLVQGFAHHRIVNRNEDNEFRMLSFDLSDKFLPVALYVRNPYNSE